MNTTSLLQIRQNQCEVVSGFKMKVLNNRITSKEYGSVNVWQHAGSWCSHLNSCNGE